MFPDIIMSSSPLAPATSPLQRSAAKNPEVSVTKTFDVAHIREQGVDIIIVPMDTSFGYKTEREQNEFSRALETFAHDAGMAGTVVPVWDSGGGRMAFLAPRNYHPFFQSIGWDDVAININKTLTCYV
jgi:hypothetical protein